MTTNSPAVTALERYGASLMPLFSPSRVLTHGEGSYVWDVDGRRYLDLLAGIAVNSLGHAHPAIVQAITVQAAALMHVSNLFASEPQVELAEKLLHVAKAPEGSGVFFTNSGTESNEAAFKLARRTGKPRVIALEHSFHGRTMGALALTHKEAYRTPFAPLPGGVEFLPPNDIPALERALASNDVAAVIAEPIQGEAGVLPLGIDYLRAMRELTRSHGALMILDEVQTGIARTGNWFAHHAAGIQPDAMTLAKGLGGGFPIGALVTFGTAATRLLQPGQHGTTFGGNPLGAAVALAVLDTIQADGIFEAIAQRSEQVRTHVTADLHPDITGVRGAGLLLGISLRSPIATQAVTAGLEHGFIINATDSHTIRIAPPLNIRASELDTFIQALPTILDDARGTEQIQSPREALSQKGDA